MGSRQRRQYANLAVPRTHWDLRVELPEDGMRLDRFLKKRVEWKSRNELQQMVDDGLVLVNAEHRKCSTRLRNQDHVVVNIPREEGLPDPAQIPIRVIVDDGVLLAIDKQPGIVVHPTSGHTLDNVLSALHARYRVMEDPERDRVPHICHRIDRETSGVLLFATDERAKANVSLQFEARTVRKEYLALVHGVPDPGEGTIDAPILHRRVGWPRLVVDDAGQPSRTDYSVEKRLGSVALVRFFPRTGRTHQIRVHSSHVGHPLLCDETYGGTRPIDAGAFRPEDTGRVLLERVALHSTMLDFDHPVTGERTTIRSPLPPDLASVVRYLEEHLPGGAG